MPRADPLGPLGGPYGRNEDREREREEEQSGLEEVSYQTLQTISGAMGYER